MLYQEIKKCRICDNENLVSILNLGNQALTGVFPSEGEVIEIGPLEIVKCFSEDKDKSCGLLQLKHNYEMEKLYGDNYGYRSGLNKSMVRHLEDIVAKIEKTINLEDEDLIIDIASNDGTLLASYKNTKLDLLGIDPTVTKFKTYYPDYIDHVADFYSEKIVKLARGDKKAKVVTSISMFYDLPLPLLIMREIVNVLDDEGIWVVEQSYMPNMINNTSYDTICHEHLEFYALRQFKWMADKADLKIIDIEFNDTNGASFCLTLAKKNSSYKEASDKINEFLNNEEKNGFNDLDIYQKFKEHSEQHAAKLKNTLLELKKNGGKIFGYGASTKGNVLLQYCGLTKEDIPFIADVNEYKHGRFTPGTMIPIISEDEAKKLKPDYFLVLPWHFKKNIIEREDVFIKNGGKLIFPLPEIEIIG